MYTVKCYTGPFVTPQSVQHNKLKFELGGNYTEENWLCGASCLPLHTIKRCRMSAPRWLHFTTTTKQTWTSSVFCFFSHLKEVVAAGALSALGYLEFISALRDGPQCGIT
jgi:hypothetical protein